MKTTVDLFESTAITDAAKRVVSPRNTGPQLLEINSHRQTLKSKDRVFVKEGSRGWFVPVLDIVVFESEGNCSRVSFEQHRPLVPRSLNYLQERLDPTVFFRASRKHIVNLRRVKTIEVRANSTLVLHMSDGSEVPMSRRRARMLKELTAI